MAKNARAGELRTRIRVIDTSTGGKRVDADGVPVAGDTEVYAGYCKWVNAHGSEVYDAKQAGVTEPATLTMRYTPKITPTSRIYRDEEKRPYEVVSVNDVEDRHVWLEIRVQRKAASK